MPGNPRRRRRMNRKKSGRRECGGAALRRRRSRCRQARLDLGDGLGVVSEVDGMHAKFAGVEARVGLPHPLFS